MTSSLRQLPAVGALLKREVWRDVPPSQRTVLARETIAAVRAQLLADPALEVDAAVSAELAERVQLSCEPSLRRVLNGSGVLLHTNAGRAPLPEGAAKAIAEVARGYCNLEFSLATGQRGSRQEHVRTLLRWLTGAEDALVVNNGAAAVLLALHGLARGRAVLVSRGELVEIGGGFRIPEVMAAAGCTLREIGTTNRTHLRDYAEAADDAACLLQVHRSNFAVVGFTATPSLTDLVKLARRRKVPLVVDLGSGALQPLPATVRGPTELAHRGEPTVPEVVAQGADVVCFSGDKLLGGPQAGILAGKASIIRRLAAQPMARALRVDDLVLAGLEHVLREHWLGRAASSLPALWAAGLNEAELQAIGHRLQARLDVAGLTVALLPAKARWGGGVDPLVWLPSLALVVRVPGRSGAWLARQLRRGQPALLGRVRGEHVWCDLRSLVAGQPDEQALADELAAVLRTAQAAVDRRAPSGVPASVGAAPEDDG
jgi:L-seryl-tRNA(Ser) seleniumtransferase